MQSAEYTLQIPSGVEYKTVTRHLENKPERLNHNGADEYHWKLSGFKAIDEEPVMADIDSFIPLMMLKPKEFVCEKYSGSLNSWNDVGKFEWALLKDRDVLPEPFVEKLKNMVAGLTSDKEKAKKSMNTCKNRHVM